MANSNLKGCFFHPDFKVVGKCSVCQRSFCNACLKGRKFCWACVPLVNVRNEDDVEIKRIEELKGINVPFGRGLNLNTTKIDIYGIFKNTRTVFHGEVLSLNCLIWPNLSTPPNTKIKVYSENREFGIIRSMWDPYNHLVYTSVDVRKFTGILKRILFWILSAVLSYILVIAYTMITKNINFLEFLNQRPGINYWIFFLLFIFIGLILTKFLVIPSRWSPGKVEMIGKIKDYVLDKWELTHIRRKSFFKSGWKAFLVLIPGERVVLLEGTKEEIQIGGREGFHNIENFLEEAKSSGIFLKFTGRELFNVLVCNLEDKYCKIEEIVSPSSIRLKK